MSNGDLDGRLFFLLKCLNIQSVLTSSDYSQIKLNLRIPLYQLRTVNERSFKVIFSYFTRGHLNNFSSKFWKSFLDEKNFFFTSGWFKRRLRYPVRRCRSVRVIQQTVRRRPGLIRIKPNCVLSIYTAFILKQNFKLI